MNGLAPFILSLLASVAQFNILGDYLRCCVYQQFPLFQPWKAFHCVNTQQYVSSFSCGWTFRWFLVWVSVNTTIMIIYCKSFVDFCLHFSWINIWIRTVGSLGTCIFNLAKKNPKKTQTVFQSGFSMFHSPPQFMRIQVVLNLWPWLVTVFPIQSLVFFDGY